MSLASRIDHTILKPDARGADVHRAIAEAFEYGFAAYQRDDYAVALQITK